MMVFWGFGENIQTILHRKNHTEVKNVKTGLSKVVFSATAIFLILALIAPGITASEFSSENSDPYNGADSWTNTDPNVVYDRSSEATGSTEQMEEQESMIETDPGQEMPPEEEIPPEMPIEEIDPDDPDLTAPTKQNAKGKGEAPGQARKLIRKSK
jgi:hypothetical protein